MTKNSSQPTEVKIRQAKGRPLLQWVGKRPLSRISPYPAQHVETHDPTESLQGPNATAERWADWPEAYPRGGLLFHGDNKEVLAHLLANGFRGKVDLIYIDPPFDSGADYVRSVSLRGSASRAKLEGEAHSLGEQIQYTDIWTNDAYLQFMFERIQLLYELLRDGGSLWLHSDWHKSHHLRVILDEVFGAEHLVNEVIWQRTDPHNDAKGRLGRVHDALYWYAKGDGFTYNWEAVVEQLSDAALKEYSLVRLPDGTVEKYQKDGTDRGRRFKLDDCTWKGSDPSRRFEWRGATPSDKRVWPYDHEGMEAALERGEFYLRDLEKGAARCRVSYLDEREGQVLQSIWTEVGRMKGGVDYPTEKPQALLSRIVLAASNEGDLVLDSFVGSGKFAMAAQSLGRRWIACDINRGAIQLSARRLQNLIQQQSNSPQLVSEDGSVDPAQVAFTIWRVNDYDLQVQHNEAVNLVSEFMGIAPTRSDRFFDGVLGSSLVKIVPFNHPMSPLDLEELKRELDSRPDETRTITMVSLGVELSAQAWVDDWNRLRKGKDAVNRIEVVELRTDPRFGGVIRHEHATAMVQVERSDGRIHVEVKDFLSPTIIQRLEHGGGLLAPQIDDWRAMVDSIAIDPSYDGSVLNVSISDVPEQKSDLVVGHYELAAPNGETTVAIKIVDMLGEEVLVTKTV